ncbi:MULTISPECIES: hypothetical protein [Microbacterium]|uniref:hypothetical protein n=1 Tax=Microbacterium TaxID=33882 RepID=UPI00046AB1E9|nr:MULTISPECIES: hypothetical protein [Microbacterium]AMG84642.1 hypothetical protein AXH82_15495 [Microbacterium sp. PAMC 28756]QXE28523.1 hypothetical protein IZR02_08855 [Microbacterium paraoxydans]
MSQDYEVDTDVLRTMAAKTRRIVADIGATDLTPPTSAGHEWVVAEPLSGSPKPGLRASQPG